MHKFHSFLFAACAIGLLAPDKGGGSSSAKAKVETPTDGAITVPDGAEIIDEPLSSASPGTVNQPVANPSEEAKRSYRSQTVDGKPLEINERPARLAGNIAHIGGAFGGETAQDRQEAQLERAKAAADEAKAAKK